ncbi:MAG: hypothetical protein DRN95_05530 [Candidatus Hydrothermarchaeota archaeon]|nr:MAG: hypothetical protein DRN95_05530 [Candidatus Hydrothermarchaeota archaeon]
MNKIEMGYVWSWLERLKAWVAMTKMTKTIQNKKIFPVIVKKGAPTYLKINIERKGVSIIAYTEDGRMGPYIVVHTEELPNVIEALKKAEAILKKKKKEIKID